MKKQLTELKKYLDKIEESGKLKIKNTQITLAELRELYSIGNDLAHNKHSETIMSKVADVLRQLDFNVKTKGIGFEISL